MGMRHPLEIAEEMEGLVSNSDREVAHMEADSLLIELIEQLAPSPQQAPPVHAAVLRIVRAWREGSEHWWWA